MADYAIHEETLIAQANMIRKKFGTSDRQDPADYAKKMNLMGVLEEKVASSASICILEDGADDVPTSSVKVSIPANLDGKSAVEETQTGKNLVDGTNFTRGLPSTTIGASIDTISASTRYAYFGTPIKGGIYTVSSVSNDTDYYNAILIFGYTNGELSFYTNATVNASKTVDLSACDYARIAIGSRTVQITVPTDFTEYGTIQLEVGTATAYEPYTAPTTHTVQLGRTIYGGTADVVKGEGQETHARIKISDLNWTYYTGGTNPIFYAINVPNMKICERGEMPSIVIDGYVTRTAHSRSNLSANMADMECSAIENAQTITFRNDTYTSVSDMLAVLGDEYIVYELATPIDFTFTGQEINTRLGYNAFWSDEGDTEVTYRASGTVTPVVPTLISKTITANGTYSASDDGADGYNEVVVNVASAEPAVTPLNSPNAFLTLSGVTGTDVERTVRTETAPSNGKYVFASDSTCRTNTGSGDGFFDIRKNDVSVVKQYMAANTTTPISIPEIEVETGDEVDIIVGFDNAHSSCDFQLYTGIAFVSNASTPSLLSMGGGNSGSTEESEEVSEYSDNEEQGEEI